MPLTIPDAFRQTFADTFRETVQQTSSRLRKTVRTESGLTGVGKQIDFVLPIESEETTGQRYKKVVLKDLETDMRWYYPKEFQAVTGESKWDENSLAPTVMPNGKHVSAHVHVFNRDCDAVILGALLGDARTGKNGETATALPSSQIVEVEYVYTGAPANSRLTPHKIIEGIHKLKASEAWGDDQRAMGEKLWCVIDSAEEAYLRHLANASSNDRLFSRDFDPPTYAADGTLVSWLGVQFVMYENLTTETVAGASGNVTAKLIPLYTSSAIEFGIWGDLASTVDIRPDLSNAVQFLSQYKIGAGREQEKKVVRIECLVP